MLSGEGNAGERRKTTIDLISKRATLHVQHTFFVHFFAIVLHDYNVKLPETSQLYVLWRECRTYYRSLFFSLPLIFTLNLRPLAFLIFSPPLKNFHVVLPTKKCLPYFFYLSLQIAVALFLDELRWPTSYFPFFSVFLFLFLYIPNLWT